jgi:hypothetical protein
MTRPRILAAVAIAALPALPGCGGDSPRAAAPRSRVSEQPAGTLVYVSGSNRLTAVDVASGRRRVRRVPSVAACGPQLHVTAGHVVFAGVKRGRTTVFAAPVSLDRPPVRLGAAHAFVPSATEGRVWLAGLDCDRPAMVGVEEVTVGGRVTVASRRRVPGSWLAAAVHRGLVIQRGRSLLVWDPRTGRTLRRLPLATVTEGHGDLMIGCTARSRCRDLAVVDAATARTVVARPTGRRRLDIGAALSPDGTLLAAPARRKRRWSVALVDTRSGATAIVRGSQTGTTYPQLSWARPSGWLFIRGRGGRILAHRPGASRAVRLPLRLPPEAAAFAAG